MVRTFERRVASRGQVAAALAGLISMGLFGLLTMINKAAKRMPPAESPPAPVVVAKPPPDAPEIEKPKPPEGPKEHTVQAKLPELVTPVETQPIVPTFEAPSLVPHGVGSFVTGSFWTPEKLFEPGELDQRPNPIHRVKPEYPHEKKLQKVDGWARVVFVVDELGRVRDPEVEAASGRDFGEAALRAIRSWRFEPGMKDGRAVQTRLRQPFTFSTAD